LVVETPKAPLAVTSKASHTNNLTRFENDGIEIFIDTQGNSFASISGVARMAEKSASTIQRFTALRNFALRETQVVMERGFKTVALLDEDQIIEVLKKYNTEPLMQFAKLGVKTALHQLAGYEPQQYDRPDLDTFTIYDLKPWQIERICAAIEYRKGNESIPAAYFEGMENFDELIWEIPFDVVNWLQSLHQDLIEEFAYRKCLESPHLATNQVLQNYAKRFEKDAAVRDYSEVRDMATLIEPFERIQLVERELAKSKLIASKPKGFGKPKK
jgi:hypothetical protein